MAIDFLAAVEQRRTVYAISKETVLPDQDIIDIVNHAVKHAPSSFNSQSARVVVLLGEQHNKFWDITKQILKGIVPADQFPSTEERINGFRNGYGSVLFFEDNNVVEGLQNNFPTYQDKFPVWSNHSSGMLQYIVWTALETKGFGASLQHYNPLVDESVQKEWGVPANWKLQAQLVFGKPVAAPGEKQFQPLEERVLVFR